MRHLRRALLAFAVPLALVACADAPVAPQPTQPTPVDALNALADSLGAGDPLAGFLRAGAGLAARIPRTATVTLTVDGVAQPFQAFAMETLTPSSILGDALDTRMLFAFDARMQHFVQVTVISATSGGTSRFAGVTGVYGERVARGQTPRTFIGTGSATGTRGSTGSACPSRPGDSQIVVSCVEAAFDFSFAFDARPIDLSVMRFAPAGAADAPIAHTLRMSPARVPGALLTLKNLPSLGSLTAATGH